MNDNPNPEAQEMSGYITCTAHGNLHDFKIPSLLSFCQKPATEPEEYGLIVVKRSQDALESCIMIRA